MPRGWNQWAGLKGNSKYYNYDLNVNGVIEHHGENYEEDYLTDVIGRFALKFLNNQTCEKPFFMMLGNFHIHMGRNHVHLTVRLGFVNQHLWLGTFRKGLRARTLGLHYPNSSVMSPLS